MYKPIYSMGISEMNMRNKNFNFTSKTFKTIPKKSDPVSKYQNFNKGWKQSKFLKNTQNKGT